MPEQGDIDGRVHFCFFQFLLWKTLGRFFLFAFDNLDDQPAFARKGIVGIAGGGTQKRKGGIRTQMNDPGCFAL